MSDTKLTQVDTTLFTLRALQMEQDIPIIHDWVNREYARYWQMQHTSTEDVKAVYTAITQTKGTQVLMGFYAGHPAFLLECYWVNEDPLSNYYDAMPGDLGFHILVAPAEKPIHNFTWNVFSVIIEYMLSEPAVHRLVVEPDVRNEKIHILNKRAGFEYQKIISLPQKDAYLGFCTREQYNAAKSAGSSIIPQLFSRQVTQMGHFSFRPLQLDTDIFLIHNWVNREYAKYWQMQHTSIEQVKHTYTSIIQSKHAQAFLGFCNNVPAFLWESYYAANDPIGKYYDVQEGDYGLHLLVAPPDRVIHGYTLQILHTIMQYMLMNDAVKRVIVEPDIRNEKMHVLTQKVGFAYTRELQLPHKKAYLAFCTREQYAATLPAATLLTQKN
ncbi:GNAT family N-acetyltransferase [Chitinophaga sp. Cy-1792]|uniref:GNAT family N-acetyltransferase n=1 Tax=Chitinophaga sp. Cy-1792 TaxID=2608339 RepID=UPI0014230E28|nr:GNAT family N-acetyltransferase [Chitinophaga sp. Cy-1792]NIG56237.1 acetyltransferase [Chitinophaga sp. Cy-1792]